MRDCGCCAAECLGARAPALPHQQLQHAQAPWAAPRSAPACQQCSPSAAGGRRAPRRAARSRPPTLWRARPPSAAPQAWEACAQQMLLWVISPSPGCCCKATELRAPSSRRMHPSAGAPAIKVHTTASTRLSMRFQRTRHDMPHAGISGKGAPAACFMAGRLRQLHAVGLFQPLPGYSLRNDGNWGAHICESVNWDHP